MEEIKISLNKVNLHYASVAYKERSIKTFITNIFKIRYKTAKVSDIHALKDITLEIKEGERVGLLGHNGSGKSTFLKTIASLYPISSGKLNVCGNIRALLDLTFGFEIEATGRENIMYRGLLLGLKPCDIKKKQKEIIEFADIGKFIDYPLKVYSAGMQIRLAFAISTAVGGDILLIDEVIGAVDNNFMAKAKSRLMKLIQESKIIILATHDLIALEEMCNRALVFYQGKLIFDGETKAAIKEYNKVNRILIS